jgi:hypothetical protein
MLSTCKLSFDITKGTRSDDNPEVDWEFGDSLKT